MRAKQAHWPAWLPYKLLGNFWLLVVGVNKSEVELLLPVKGPLRSLGRSNLVAVVLKRIPLIKAWRIASRIASVGGVNPLAWQVWPTFSATIRITWDGDTWTHC